MILVRAKARAGFTNRLFEAGHTYVRVCIVFVRSMEWVSLPQCLRARPDKLRTVWRRCDCSVLVRCVCSWARIEYTHTHPHRGKKPISDIIIFHPSILYHNTPDDNEDESPVLSRNLLKYQHIYIPYMYRDFSRKSSMSETDFIRRNVPCLRFTHTKPVYTHSHRKTHPKAVVFYKIGTFVYAIYMQE